MYCGSQGYMLQLATRGQRTRTVREPRPWHGDPIYTYNLANQLNTAQQGSTTWQYTCNANGILISDGVKTSAYDPGPIPGLLITSTINAVVIIHVMWGQTTIIWHPPRHWLRSRVGKNGRFV